jgi:hypothetical protein
MIMSQGRQICGVGLGKLPMHDYNLALQEGRNMNIGCKSLVNTGWTPPISGWVKINTDGAQRRDGRVGCGCLIRGENKE